LFRDIVNYLESLPIGDNPHGPIFASLRGKPSGSHGGLSNAFNRFMQKARVRVPVELKSAAKVASFARLDFTRCATHSSLA